MSDERKGIKWGGLIKGLVATAAVIGGVELLFPGFTAGVISAVKSVGTAIADKVTTAATEGAGKAAESAAESAAPGKLATAIGWLATKIGGVVLAASGLKYLMSDHSEPERDTAAEESFAAREDIRRMQALMMARMQAQGYAPAMAMAQQQGQGR